MDRRTLHRLVLGITLVAMVGAGAWLAGSWWLSRGPFTGTMRHDFGIVPVGDEMAVASHTFRLINASDRVVRVEKFWTSCGCTTHDLVPSTYAPGEALEFTVSLALNRSRLRETWVRLQLADGRLITFNLRGQGRRTQAISAVPPFIQLTEGMPRIVLRIELELFDGSVPPDPEVAPPVHMAATWSGWTLRRRARRSTREPAIWSGDLSLSLDGAPPEAESELVVRVDPDQELLIPVNPETPIPIPSGGVLLSE